MANADLPTKPSVANPAVAEVRAGVAGEAIASAGMWGKLNSSGQYVKADRDADGDYAVLMLASAASGQPLDVVWRGVVGGFSDLTPGTTYYLSDTAGRMCPIADVSGNFVPVCVALSATHVLVLGNAAVQAAQALPDAIGFAVPGADLGAGVTYEQFLLKVPTGYIFTIIEIHIWNTDVGAAGCLVDPEIDGTDILASPLAVNDNAITTISAGDMIDTTVAAGQVLSAEFVTGASTGTLARGHGVVIGLWSAA